VRVGAPALDYLIEMELSAIAADAAAAAVATAAARIMHYLQLLFPLRLKSEI